MRAGPPKRSLATRMHAESSRSSNIMKSLGIKSTRKNSRKILMIPSNFFRVRILPRGVRKDNGCLIWPGKVQSEGYGQIRYGSITVSVHRFAALVYGLIDSLDSPLFVCHSCNNPICFDKEHLRADTQLGNLQQMYNEGRDRNQYTKDKL